MNIQWFGALGDGISDDSRAIQAAAATGKSLLFPPGRTYNFSDVILSNSQVAYAEGAVLRCAQGGASLFRLKDYAPKVRGAYVADARACTEAAIVVDDSVMAQVLDFHIVNAANAIKVKSSSLGKGLGARRTMIANGFVDTFSGIGLHISRDSSDSIVTNVFIDAGAVEGRPRSGSTGVRVDSRGSVGGYGGHSFSTVNVINAQNGWEFIDAELIKLANCISDGNSGFGVRLDGATRYVDFDGMFIGSSGNAIYAGSGTTGITFSALRTIFSGLAPPWASSKPIEGVTNSSPPTITVKSHGFRNGDAVFFSDVSGMPELNGRTFAISATTTDTFQLQEIDGTALGRYLGGGRASNFFVVAGNYDLVLDGTASLTIDAGAWYGGKNIRGSELASLVLQNAQSISFRSAARLLPDSVWFLSEAGARYESHEASWTVEDNVLVTELSVRAERPPGEGEQYTYSLLVNGVPTPLRVTLEGLQTKGTSKMTTVPARPGDALVVQVITTASAASATHSGTLQLIRRGG